MIFDPPSLPNRAKNKLYGRRCLKHEYPIQHKCYVDNYKKTNAWVSEGQSIGHLPQGAFTLEDPLVRDALKTIISEKKDNLMDINFGKNEEYAWREADVYKKSKKNLKYRRWKQRKAEKARGCISHSPSQPEVFSEHRESESFESRELVPHSMLDEEEEGDDESFVMRRLDFENVNEMYAGLSNFMNGENASARSEGRRIPFPPNSRSFSDGDKLFLVITYLRTHRE